MQDYRKAVAANKKAMQERFTRTHLLEKSRRSVDVNDELRTKSTQREQLNSTYLTSQDRNSRLETIRTLESVDNKIGAHREKAQKHKESLSQKISKDVERVFIQKSKHREEQERAEIEREFELLLKINKRKDALKKYERQKRKETIKIEERNEEKRELTKQYLEKSKQERKELARLIREKERKKAK